MLPQGDSGYDAALYAALAAAPVVLLDGRARGTSEHAGFAQIAAAGAVLAASVDLCTLPTSGVN